MEDHEYVKLFTERFNRKEGTHFKVEDIEKLYKVAGLNEDEINPYYVPEKDCPFHVGDLVCVTKWGKSYSTYRDFFQDDKMDFSYKVRYAYGDTSHYDKFPNEYDDNTQYRILYIKYDEKLDELLALITKDCEWMTDENENPIYLIQVDSLEK